MSERPERTGSISRFEQVDRQVQDVAVHEEQDLGVGVGDADRHRPPLALVLPQVDGAQAQRAGDLDRAVGRAVGDHEDLVDRRRRLEDREDLGRVASSL